MNSLPRKAGIQLEIMEGTFSGSTFRLALVALENSGFETDSILQECQISRKNVESPWTRISAGSVRRFFRAAIERSGDNQIPLKMAKQVPLGAFPLLDYV